MSPKHRTLAAGIVLSIAAGAGCQETPPETPVSREHVPISNYLPRGADTDGPTLFQVEVDAAEEILELARARHWEAGLLQVPAVAPRSLPPDLEDLTVRDRKRAFFGSLLPIILHENAVVLRERERLVRLIEGEGPSPAEEMEWLNGLMRRYRITRRDPGETEFLKQVLLRRVDAVPVEIALAQAANESAWGLSRFAREGNAFFGQWTWDSKREGMVPSGREEGATHRVEAFPSIQASVRSYVRNLNTHGAYADFRGMRAEQRSASGEVDAVALTQTLLKYSARGEEYVKELRQIIRVNRLGRFEDAVLVEPTDELLAACAVCGSAAADTATFLVAK